MPEFIKSLMSNAIRVMVIYVDGVVPNFKIELNPSTTNLSITLVTYLSYQSQNH